MNKKKILGIVLMLPLVLLVIGVMVCVPYDIFIQIIVTVVSIAFVLMFIYGIDLYNRQR